MLSHTLATLARTILLLRDTRADYCRPSSVYRVGAEKRTIRQPRLVHLPLRPCSCAPSLVLPPTPPPPLLSLSLRCSSKGNCLKTLLLSVACVFPSAPRLACHYLYHARQLLSWPHEIGSLACLTDWLGQLHHHRARSFRHRSGRACSCGRPGHGLRRIAAVRPHPHPPHRA